MLFKVFLLFNFMFFCNAYSISIYDINKENYQENYKNNYFNGTDQGSISKKKWEQFKKIITYYDEYKKNINKINNKFEDIFVYDYLNSLKNKLSEYYTMLVILEKYYPYYFNNLYAGKDAEHVYQEKVEQLYPIILKIINTAAHSLIQIYSNEFPMLIYEVDFKSWAKAYWGSLNTENRWGFEPAHYYNNSIDPLYKSKLFNFFVEEVSNGESDLNNKRVFLGVNWANANTVPLTSKIEKKLQYKLISISNFDFLKDYFDLNPVINKKLISNEKIKKKFNLLNKKIKTIDNYFNNILKNIDKKNNSNFNKKLVNIVNYSANKCLYAVEKSKKTVISYKKEFYGISLSWEKCSKNNESQKWHVIKNNQSLNSFKIYSAYRKGYCLDDSSIFGLSLTSCNNKFKRQNWNFQSDQSIANQKTGYKIFENVKIQENLYFSLISMINIPFNENIFVTNLEPFINRFFQIVDDNDIRLQVMNGNRMPSYLQVWDKWSNNEWNPPEEFNNIFRQTSFLRQGLSEEQFNNIFQNIQDLSLRDAIMSDTAEVEYLSSSSSDSLPPFYQEAEDLSFWDNSFDTESMTSTNSTAELQAELRAFEIDTESENMLQSEEFLNDIQDLSQIFDEIESSSNILNSNIQILLQSVTTLSTIGNIALSATIVTLIP